MPRVRSGRAFDLLAIKPSLAILAGCEVSDDIMRRAAGQWRLASRKVVIVLAQVIGRGGY